MRWSIVSNASSGVVSAIPLRAAQHSCCATKRGHAARQSCSLSCRVARRLGRQCGSAGITWQGSAPRGSLAPACALPGHAPARSGGLGRSHPGTAVAPPQPPSARRQPVSGNADALRAAASCATDRVESACPMPWLGPAAGAASCCVRIRVRVGRIWPHLVCRVAA